MNDKNIAKKLNKIYKNEPNIDNKEAMEIIEAYKRSEEIENIDNKRRENNEIK